MLDWDDTAEDWTAGTLSRKRWNVLDMITIVARRSRPAYLFCDVDVTAAQALKNRLSAQGTHVTITAILLKAISIAQLYHPSSRSYRLASGRRVTEKEPIAGFTVERKVGAQPVVFFANIRGAHEKSLQAIGEELEGFAKKSIAQMPSLKKEISLTRIPWLVRQAFIWAGMRMAALRRSVNPATFGLTSLGKLGIQSLVGPTVSTCIFGVGAIEERVSVINKTAEVRKMMTLTLSVDTEVMYMCDAASMLSQVKDLVEEGLIDHLAADESEPEVIHSKLNQPAPEVIHRLTTETEPNVVHPVPTGCAPDLVQLVPEHDSSTNTSSNAA